MYNNLFVNSKVISGKDCLVNNSNLLHQFGKKCLIVTGKSGAKKSGALDDAVTALSMQEIEFGIYDNIGENPLVSSVIEGGKCAREMGADFIMGIGGGSALDASKAVAICAANPEFDIDGLYNRQNPAKALPVVLVGTTAGTGSEVTGVSVLTNDNNMQKKSIGGADCYAALVFADAKYTYSMPYNTTVSTALDAFAHAVEGFFSPKCTEYPEVYARMAIPVIYKGLKTLYNEKALPSKDVRDELFLGSLYAGLELNVCGAAFPHTVGYILTEEFGVPHGKACAALMPHLLMKAKRHSTERFLEFLRLTGENEVKVIETIKALSDVKINATDEQLDEWCTRWGDVKNFHNTPGDFTNEEAVEALKEIIAN